MQIPAGLFELALWSAVLAVGAAAVYLLALLVYEALRRELW